MVYCGCSRWPLATVLVRKYLFGLRPDRVGRCRVQGQQNVRDRLATIVLVAIDLSQYAIHFVVLKQHSAATNQRILNPFTAGEFVPQRTRHANSLEHVRIDFAREFLPGSAAGQRQQIQIGSQIPVTMQMPSTGLENIWSISFGLGNRDW